MEGRAVVMRIAIEPIAALIGLPSEDHDDWKAVPDGFLPALVTAKQFLALRAQFGRRAGAAEGLE